MFKDEDLPLQELDAAFERAGLIVERRFFDSVAWFWLSDLERTPLRGVSRRIGHRLQRLEGSDRVAALFCDQVKYRLRIPENAGTESAPEWRCPACQGELVSTGTGLRCDGCSASYGMLRGRAPIFFGSTASSAGDPIHTTILTRSAFRLAFAAHTLLYLPAMALSALIRR